MNTVQGVHHVKLPVSELTRSRGWYESVLGVRPALEFPDGNGVIRGVAYHPLGALTLCLREDPARAAALAGFNPLAVLVATRADLEKVTAHLDLLGVAHGPVVTATLGWLLSAPDPDSIDLRFYTAEHHPTGVVPGVGITAGPGLNQPEKTSRPALPLPRPGRAPLGKGAEEHPFTEARLAR